MPLKPAQSVDEETYIAGLTHLKRSTTTVPVQPQAETLETFENRYAKRDYWITFTCPEFTACCPVTGQPDFGEIRIRYVPDRTCIESKALKLYLFSYRNFNTFHEEAVNRILEDVISACSPRQIEVDGQFKPRGGISISVTAMYKQP